MTRGDSELEVLEVLDPGPLTTVQDLGRPGFAHLGVPRSGAADRASLTIANRLVGNDPASAAFETTVRGPTLRALRDCTVALAGAPVRAVVGERPLSMGTATRLRAGATLRVGVATHGLRTYLAVAGGLAGPLIMGSRSSDLLSGLGPAPLRRGDRLSIVDEAGPPGRPGSASEILVADALLVVELILGPRDDWLTAESRSRLGEIVYRVAADSSRVGVRLQGEALTLAREDALRSEGVVPGAVQVPPSGMPIVLLADHPTTGGYPVVGVVPAHDLDRLAQRRPGEAVRFRPGSPPRAFV